jgi:hypothetical protein
MACRFWFAKGMILTGSFVCVNVKATNLRRLSVAAEKTVFPDTAEVWISTGADELVISHILSDAEPWTVNLVTAAAPTDLLSCMKSSLSLHTREALALKSA